MSRALGLVVLVIACGDNHRGSPPADTADSAGPADAAIDAPLDAPDGLPPDTTPPGTTLTQAPAPIEVVGTATVAFTGDEPSDRFECALDGAAFAACTSPLELTVADGAHTFAVRAIDLAGNADPTPASAAWTVDTRPMVCGSGIAEGLEACDGADLRGATCASLGHAPGTLACAATCDAFELGGCTGPFAPANTGFTGTVCFDGVKYATPNLTLPYVLVCTEDHGVFKTTLDAATTWSSLNAGGITNLRGRAVATNPNGPPIYYVSNATTANNGFRSSNQGATWTAQSIHDAGAPRELYSMVFRQTIGNLAGSWDPVMGAIVLHGSPPALAPHFIGATPGTVTGTARGIANGGPSDVFVAVYGQTPSGGAATGGIFRACDLTMTGGGTYARRDTGIAAEDLGRVWSITVDPASVVMEAFACGAEDKLGYATTYYAALRGGGQIYKTIDNGVTWTRRNAGLPAGAEVYAIAIDCFNPITPAQCQDRDLLYAATSQGLYKSVNAGATWTLEGFEGKAVRGLAIDPQPATNPPRMFVGVDDAVGLYQSLQ